MNLIISHNNCPDGWCAAYVAKKRYPEAEIMLLNHGLDEGNIAAIIAACSNADVLMLDYSLRTRELNDQLNSVAKSFRILDHHKTAQAALDGAPYATFDMKRSGVGLAWDYLFGENSPEACYDQGTSWEPRPWWVNYTEDQDLWNWALPDSHVINAYLMVQPRTVETWDRITHPFKMDEMKAKEKGEGVRQYIEYYTRCVVAEAQVGVYSGHRVAVLNIPYAGVSEAGTALAVAGFDVVFLWFENHEGKMLFSLRSNRDGKNVDVSEIAKSYGGGGHRNAAGFQMGIYAGRQLVDQILNRGTYGTVNRCS